MTGVEINRNMLDLINGPLGDFTGHLELVGGRGGRYT